MEPHRRVIRSGMGKRLGERGTYLHLLSSYDWSWCSPEDSATTKVQRSAPPLLCPPQINAVNQAGVRLWLWRSCWISWGTQRARTVCYVAISNVTWCIVTTLHNIIVLIHFISTSLIRPIWDAHVWWTLLSKAIYSTAMLYITLVWFPGAQTHDLSIARTMLDQLITGTSFKLFFRVSKVLDIGFYCTL